MKQQFIKFGLLSSALVALSCSQDHDYKDTRNFDSEGLPSQEESHQSDGDTTGSTNNTNQFQLYFPTGPALSIDEPWTNATTSDESPESPCPFRPGRAWPGEGSGACRGNVQVSIPLPAVGLQLTYNSAGTQTDRGFGEGWTLSMDKHLKIDGSRLTSTTGDGTPIPFSYDEGKDSFLPARGDLSNHVFSFTKNANGSIVKILETNPKQDISYIYELNNADEIQAECLISWGESCSLSASLLKVKLATGAEVRYYRNSNLHISTMKFTNPNSTSHPERILTFNKISSDTTDIYWKDAPEASYRIKKWMFRDKWHLTSVTGPHAVQWRMSHRLGLSGNRLLQLLVSPETAQTSFHYYKNDLLRSVVNTLNHTTNFEYSSNYVKKSDFYGDALERFLSNNRIEVTNNGLSSMYHYDNHHRLRKTTDDLGRITLYGYPTDDDNFFVPDEITNPDGSKTIIARSNDKVVRIKELSTNGTLYLDKRYSYSGDNLVRETINGQSRTFSYDSDDNLIGATNFDGQPTMNASYDGPGRLSQVSDGVRTKSLNRGARGLVTAIHNSHGPTVNIQYATTGLAGFEGKPSQITSGNETLQYTYGVDGRVLEFQATGEMGRGYSETSEFSRGSFNRGYKRTVNYWTQHESRKEEHFVTPWGETFWRNYFSSRSASSDFSLTDTPQASNHQLACEADRVAKKVSSQGSQQADGGISEEELVCDSSQTAITDLSGKIIDCEAICKDPNYPIYAQVGSDDHWCLEPEHHCRTDQIWLPVNEDGDYWPFSDTYACIDKCRSRNYPNLVFPDETDHTNFKCVDNDGCAYPMEGTSAGTCTCKFGWDWNESQTECVHDPTETIGSSSTNNDDVTDGSGDGGGGSSCPRGKVLSCTAGGNICWCVNLNDPTSCSQVTCTEGVLCDCP